MNKCSLAQNNQKCPNWQAINVKRHNKIQFMDIYQRHNKIQFMNIYPENVCKLVTF